MHNNRTIVQNYPKSIMENRDICTEFCKARESTVTNTLFRKPAEKTAGYRKRKEIHGTLNEPIAAETRGQLDQTFITRR